VEMERHLVPPPSGVLGFRRLLLGILLFSPARCFFVFMNNAYSFFASLLGNERGRSPGKVFW
jgi:hypothetical protein